MCSGATVVGAAASHGERGGSWEMDETEKDGPGKNQPSRKERHYWLTGRVANWSEGEAMRCRRGRLPTATATGMAAGRQHKHRHRHSRTAQAGTDSQSAKESSRKQQLQREVSRAAKRKKEEETSQPNT